MTVGTFALAQLLRVIPRDRITRAVGRLCDLELPPPLSRAVVQAYSRAYRVDLDEAAPRNGHGPYTTFDEFFTRPLRDGVRDLAGGDDLVSPADGALTVWERVDGQGDFIVKGQPYRAVDLLGSEEEAARYQGGTCGIVYLSPRDYHRVHAPAGGRLVEVRSYEGELFPVNSVSERHIPQYLARNRRVAIVLDTDLYGRITLVMVAAIVVGRITVTGIEARDVPFGVHRVDPVLECPRGAEVGVFHLGSTVVMFLENDLGKLLPREHTDPSSLGAIRVGDVLAHPPQEAAGG